MIEIVLNYENYGNYLKTELHVFYDVITREDDVKIFQIFQKTKIF